MQDLTSTGLIRRWRKHIKQGASYGGQDRITVALRAELLKRKLWRVVYQTQKGKSK